MTQTEPCEENDQYDFNYNDTESSSEVNKVTRSNLSLESNDKGRASSALQNLAGVAGNVLEWYDFAVFGYFSDIIGKVFFPPQQGHAAIVESFAVFGGAFLMRPIGGVLLGRIGDKYGRKKALQISIFLMAFPTFVMGCLPTYDSVGYTATILLTCTRLLQGLSVGGQLTSSLVFTLENNPRENWGLYGSYVMAAANAGTFIGGVVAYLLRAFLSESQLYNWGWRVPFLSGIIVSLSGVYLKFFVEDTEMQTNHPTISSSSKESKEPLVRVFRKENRSALLSACMVPILWSGGFYMCFVWMATYMQDLSNHTMTTSFAVNSMSLFLSVVAIFPLGGILSDKLGRSFIMKFGGFGMLVCSPALVIVIGYGNPYYAFFAQLLLGIFLTLWGGPMMAWLVEAFQPDIRLTAISIGYNFAQAIAGGSCPSIATIMVDDIGANSPGFLLSLFALLALVGLHIAPTNEGMMLSSGNVNEGSMSDIDLDEIPINDQEDNELL